MAGERFTVDELLARQEEPGELRATIEAVPGDDERVKVTPYVSDIGCLCSQAITVRKRQIESLVTTDETHHCCGKTLTVVTVTFADATLTDVFGQLSESARRSRDVAEPVAAGDDPALFLRRPFPAPVYDPYVDPYRMVYGDYEPRRSILSTEEAATGHPRTRPTGAAYHDVARLRRCLKAQLLCYRNCVNESDPYDPLGRSGYVTCKCNCDRAYYACMDDSYHPEPC